MFLFIIGGPGSGKGTQCQRIIERYNETVHLSMGDILRNQIAQQGSADEKWGMIGTLVQKGEMAPQVKNLIGDWGTEWRNEFEWYHQP